MPYGALPAEHSHQLDPHKPDHAHDTRKIKRPEASPILDLQAALSHQTDFAVGCSCNDEQRCHRSILRELLAEREALLA